MRHQYYADAKDAQKWSTILDLSKGRAITWVVMLRPNEGEHGQDYSKQHGHPEVISFFDQERAAGHKDLSRTSLLFDKLKIPFHIHLDLYPGIKSSQDLYFSNVVTRLLSRPESQRDVVFLDPDTGIEGKNCEHTHVRLKHIEAVWGSLRKNDCMVVYQHQYRLAGWDQVKSKAFESIAKVPIVSHGRGVVRFFAAEK